jgi:hypothetical protein
MSAITVNKLVFAFTAGFRYIMVILKCSNIIALIQHTVQEKFENTKQNKMTNNEIQDTTLKTKRTTHTLLGFVMLW